MPYDVELADRLRDQLEGTPTTEQKMFGGLAFLGGGNMAVAASSKGGLMGRCAPQDTDSQPATGVLRFGNCNGDIEFHILKNGASRMDDSATWPRTNARIDSSAVGAQLVLGVADPVNDLAKRALDELIELHRWLGLQVDGSGRW